MKQTLFIIFFLSTFTSFSQSSSDRTAVNVDSFLNAMDRREKQAVGKPFPDFNINADSVEYSNSTLKGKVVFINFWFATCPPCLAELDELNKLYTRFKDDNNFEFISFTFEDPAKIESVKKSYGMLYKVISISKDDCYRLNLNNGFPTSIILDKDGNIKLLHTGGSLDKKEIKKYFSKKYYPLISEAL